MLVMTYFQLSTKGDAEASDQEMEKNDLGLKVTFIS